MNRSRTPRRFIAGSLLVVVPAAAGAKPLASEVTVERDEQAFDCPSGDELERRVARILQRDRTESSTASDRVRVRVRFSRGSDGYRADLDFEGAKHGERTLNDQGQRCAALSDAVAVTISLLLDSTGPEAPADETTSRTVEKPQPKAVEKPSAVEKPTTTRRHVAVYAAIEGGMGWFTSSSAQPLFFGRIGVAAKPWILEAGFGAALPSTRSFQTGAVETGLLFGSARLCYSFTRSFALGPCAEFGLGSLRGSGRDYAEARSVSLLWSAVGLAALVQGELGARAYWGATATGWVPTAAQTFSVENAGVAWKSPSFAASLALRAGLRLW